MRQSKRANFILVGILALMAVAGTVAYQMTREGQPVPTAGQKAAPADQKR
jgi:hypothetical protein